jgi:hypothetical protein
MILSSLLVLSGCASERHYFAETLWPFGNPNAPVMTSETGERALGKTPDVAPLQPQPGDVWPGAVAPMPTLGDIQKDANMPLGQAFTPSLPSPYPPGEMPSLPPGSVPALNDSTAPATALPPVPAVPGDAR